MDVQLEIKGGNELIAYLRNAGESAASRASSIVAEFTDKIRNRAREKLGGQVLRRITGNLQDHLGSEVSSNESGATGTVSVKGVAYARIHEYGGVTAAHIIRPKRASVLAWAGALSGGASTMMFAKVVHHPGSRIPERSYLRTSLEEERENFIEALRARIMPPPGSLQP